MTEVGAAGLKRTPLTEWHRSHGGRMVPLAGWEMPAEYAGHAGEHMAVRTRVGLFDLSHMGQIELAGGDAVAALERLTSNDASALEIGQTQRSALTTPLGTIVDDLLVFRLAAGHFLLLVAAASLQRDLAWIGEQASPFADLAFVDTSSRYALLSLQGPASRDVLQQVASVDLASLGRGRFEHGEVAGARATVSQTGCTGEEGFEILTPPATAPGVWNSLLASGREAGIAPAGLDALETLRLEAGVARIGAELDDTVTPLEAGLESVVAWEKPDFVGRAALAAQKAQGPARRLVGFEMVDEEAAGRGDHVLAGGERAGLVTTGARAPFVGKAIGMAYVAAGATAADSELEIDVRGRRARARVVPLPFYKRPGE